MNFNIDKINREIFHREVYYFGLILLVVSLPLSVFGISLSQFILAGNWILEGNFRNKISILKRNKGLLIYTGLYIIHIIWLINTSDFNYALKDLRIKLPLLILPLIIGSTPSLKFKRIHGLIYFFSAGVVISSFISIGVLLGFSGKEINDYRDLSVYISHIRFSLMINTVIFLMYYIYYKKLILFRKSERIGVLFVIIWLAVFLFILRSQTGLVVFCLLTSFFIIRYIIISRNIYIKSAIVVIAISLITILLYTLNHVYCDYNSINESAATDKYTVNGRLYLHNKNTVRYENGYVVWNYYCEQELKTEWNKRSKLDFEGTDKIGNVLSHTLARYLTSKGLRKDSCGITALSDADINAIEGGYANYIYLKPFSLYSFLYKQFWIIDSYIKGDNPSGHSVTQRLEYIKAATCIICENYFWGTGTGDVRNAYTKYYSTYETQLEPKRQLRAHNQWLTFFLSFGLIGFILSLSVIFVPVLIEKMYKNYWFLLPFAISVISFFNEDTLETQAGVTFFTFFYVFFMANKKPRK